MSNSKMVADYLRRYNAWRRGEDERTMDEAGIVPAELGQMLDSAVELLIELDELVGALELALEYWRHRQQRYKNRKPRWVADAESTLASHRNQGGEV